MSAQTKQTLKICATFLVIFLAVRFLLPLFLPFFWGTVLALAAEPLVSALHRKLRLPRAAASGIGIGLTFLLLGVLMLLLCGFALRELGVLAGILSDMESSILSGLRTAWDFLLEQTQRTPPEIRAMLVQSIDELFSGSSDILERGVSAMLHLASGILSRIPGSMLTVGTCILSSFMISAKLPKIRSYLSGRLQASRFSAVPATLAGMKKSLLGWLKAQIKLSFVTFLLSCTGLLILRVPYAPLWAIFVALVDAFPVLGTGAVLIPWSLVSFLQADRLKAFGLLGIYALCALSRSALEPKLVGKQLGLDPLLTLLALYTGFRLWGLGGMLLAPILAVTAVQAVQSARLS